MKLSLAALLATAVAVRVTSAIAVSPREVDLAVSDVMAGVNIAEHDGTCIEFENPDFQACIDGTAVKVIDSVTGVVDPDLRLTYDPVGHQLCIIYRDESAAVTCLEGDLKTRLEIRDASPGPLEVSVNVGKPVLSVDIGQVRCQFRAFQNIPEETCTTVCRVKNHGRSCGGRCTPQGLCQCAKHCAAKRSLVAERRDEPDHHFIDVDVLVNIDL